MIKLIIKSNLGGNLRLSAPNAFKLANGILKDATGENKNKFYQIAAIPTPIISSKATLSKQDPEKIIMADFPKMPGKTNALVIK